MEMSDPFVLVFGWHYSHQMTALGKGDWAMKFLMLRSKRIRRQSLRRQNMRLMM